MAEPDRNTESLARAPQRLVERLREWTAGSSRRNRIVGAGLAAAVLATVVSWLTVAELAVADDGPSVAHALAALDNGDDERARSLIAGLDEDQLSGLEYGAAMYALGVLKVRDAQRQWAPERSRTDYFVASKYLSEARAIGFPGKREASGLFLLGKSLIESRQLEDGVAVLEAALRAGVEDDAAAHLLLADAHFFAPAPDYQRTINEADLAAEAPNATPEQRSQALLLKSEALAALGRGDEALRACQQAGGTVDPARRALVEAKALVAQVAHAPGPVTPLLISKAQAALTRAKRADNLATSVSRESDYLRAQVAELAGLREQAIAGYGELRRTQGTSPVGIAGAVAEGRLLQEEGEPEQALDSYRRAIEALQTSGPYRNGLMPMREVERRLRNAHADYLASENFSPALRLTEQLGQLLGRTEHLAMRAETLRRWGDATVARGLAKGAPGRPSVRVGRRRLREAGLAYEQLAESRFASRQFTADLLTAAEAYSDGQAYDDAIRVLNRYVRHEPEDGNAIVLLRLGQAHLARGEDTQAIEAFRRCLEFHPTDAASYQARLECAGAHRTLGEYDEAERLLRYNLTQTALTTRSPEWRASQFELGRLLAEAGRHDEAIRELEEAIERAELYHPDDHRVLQAQYRIAMSHRAAAAEPLAELAAAETVRERERARGLAHEHLEASLDMFNRVRRKLTLAESSDELDRATLRNCYVLAGDVLFELGRYDEAIQSFASVSTLHQNEPMMLPAFVQIYHCWRRLGDRPKALGVIQQARLLLERLPADAEFVEATSRSRREWDRLLGQLALF
ncbi:tetratricopeptide repeat protein [Botrimarina sp.]|uniref:tetratricopeptide repeat protein n=1 Tax=Botrimarina sp. TaxID=2795802 RepID=UPI0032EC9EB2